MILKIAENIGNLREKHDMKQSDLARRMKVSRSSVNAWEMGISVPTTEKIVELSQIFHTTSDYLLGISDTEYINLENYNNTEKEFIYRLLAYFDSIHKISGNRAEELENEENNSEKNKFEENKFEENKFEEKNTEEYNTKENNTEKKNTEDNNIKDNSIKDNKPEKKQN